MPKNKDNLMHGRKIIVCTTFREFNGNSNDKIQREFISGLKNQTYQNYLLVPTTFNEKNVEQVLQEENVPYMIFHGDAGKYLYSFSQVIENAISLIDESGKYILMWTCCDDLLDKRFFEDVMAALTPLSCCTSLPHINYKTLEDYKNRKIFNYTYGGVDLICFDGDIFLNPEAKKVIKDYPNDGQYMIEYFLSGFARVFAKNMYNIWPTKIERIDNDRKANNETSAYIEMCIAHNMSNYNAFKKKYHLRGDVFHSVLSYKTPLKYLGVKSMIYLKITKNRLEKIILRPWIFKIIPPGVKRFLKRFLGKKVNYSA